MRRQVLEPVSAQQRQKLPPFAKHVKRRRLLEQAHQPRGRLHMVVWHHRACVMGNTTLSKLQAHSIILQHQLQGMRRRVSGTGHTG